LWFLRHYHDTREFLKKNNGFGHSLLSSTFKTILFKFIFLAVLATRQFSFWSQLEKVLCKFWFAILSGT
jgi:hypothetical protein